jgi:LysM repeat protein
MNPPSPLVPQGSFERHSKGKSTVRIAIFTIVSIHAVFFAGLLMQGCRRDEGKTPLKIAEPLPDQNTLPPIDTNSYPFTPEVTQVPTPVPITPSPAPTATEFTPAPLVIPPVEPPAETKSHTIVKGDTLTKLAAAYGTTVGAISQANPDLNPSKLRPGQKVQIPPSPAPPVPALGWEPVAASSTVTDGNSIHTVKRGDNLTRIARQHGTTVKALRAANHLTSDRLAIGQKLKITH